ncbi:type II secretion system protein J [Undibacterium sp.]|uniref:type II secretion system protein J n=1 Tax=Undibacterium sp. TaxID=1914977 RepID=UPI0037509380
MKKRLRLSRTQRHLFPPPEISRRRGFTLVELIVVIVLTGIVATMMALFIRVPIQNYVDNVARAELTDAVNITANRLTRDLHLALPNSVRISADGRYLEFLLTKTGGRYLAEEDGLGLSGVLNFTAATPSPNPNTFNIVGTPPSGRQTIVAGDSIVVYNLGPGFDPSDAYNCTGVSPNRLCNRSTVVSIVGNVVTMTDNPFVNQVPSMGSPTARFQVVTTPVTYYCDGLIGGVAKTGTLTRYSGYAIQAAQPISILAAPLSTATRGRMAEQVADCAFLFNSLANVQRGLVTLRLTFGAASSSTGVVTLIKQIHINNTP